MELDWCAFCGKRAPEGRLYCCDTCAAADAARAEAPKFDMRSASAVLYACRGATLNEAHEQGLMVCTHTRARVTLRGGWVGPHRNDFAEANERHLDGAGAREPGPKLSDLRRKKGKPVVPALLDAPPAPAPAPAPVLAAAEPDALAARVSSTDGATSVHAARQTCTPSS
jgi:hypothetical protein